ncbi:methylenetetrahydrofolate reductase [Actinopolymorpha alba]|uniref:methylenetetrahydrofolate reductase n=1 Tax=Actinopolymorpha alba TaxID=533267 RepID=UPI0003602EBB|nr:methylenetetrahydrofolate reductase [Actinopolymorpha alba]
MPPRPFELICEVEPSIRPDLQHVRNQIEVLSPVADAFLAPDNHIGRATVSSVAVAHEIQRVGGRGIACLNSRDRNLLGFRRDLLTAAAYGVERFVFVYGDKPTSGNRTSDLTVRAMLEEVRGLEGDPAFTGVPPFKVGVTTGLRPLPAWKASADFVFTQVSFSLEALLRWREAQDLTCPVYAGVMVLASDGMARRLAASIPDIEIPDALIDQVARDKLAGVELACEHLEQIRESGAFDGVHLVTGVRFRPVAERLAQIARARSSNTVSPDQSDT